MCYQADRVMAPQAHTPRRRSRAPSPESAGPWRGRRGCGRGQPCGRGCCDPIWQRRPYGGGGDDLRVTAAAGRGSARSVQCAVERSRRAPLSLPRPCVSLSCRRPQDPRRNAQASQEHRRSPECKCLRGSLLVVGDTLWHRSEGFESVYLGVCIYLSLIC